MGMGRPRIENRDAHFDALVDRTRGDGACWEWKAGANTEGYGQFWNGVTTVRAPRHAFIRAFGTVPAGLIVRHTCHNRRCVNPAHLILGTNADNSHDMVIAGRQAMGERHGCAKLTDVQSNEEIPKLRRQGSTTYEIAAMYGVSQAAVWRALRRNGMTGQGRWPKPRY